MRTVFEVSAFALIAAGLHFVVWTPDQDTGLVSAGDGGEDLVQLMASNASVANMVDTWETPPDVQKALSEEPETPVLKTVLPVPPQPTQRPTATPPPPEAVKPPLQDTSVAKVASPAPASIAKTQTAPVHPTTPAVQPSAALPDMPKPMLTTPTLTALPVHTPMSPQADATVSVMASPPPRDVADLSPHTDAPTPLPSAVAPPRPAAPQMPPPPTVPVTLAMLTPDAMPQVDTEPTPPAPGIRPKQRPAAAKPSPSKPKKAKQAPAKKPASQDSIQVNARKAQGSGGATAKGDNGKAKTATLSKSKRTSLVRKWGSQIRARVARRVPKGAGRGTAVVRITVSGQGQLLGAKLVRSSGNDQIDRVALNAVKRAGQFPAAPAALNLSKRSFDLPIESK